MNIQIETVTLADGSKADVIRDIEAVRRCEAENAQLRIEHLHDVLELGELSGEVAKLREERSKFDAVHDWGATQRELDRLRLYVKEIETARIRHIAREISDAHLSAE